MNMVEDIVERMRQNGSVHNKWCTNGYTYDVWVDTSSLATGVLLEADRKAVEDAYWLPPVNDAQHIKLAGCQFSPIVGGNVAASLHGLRRCVKWASDMLTGKSRIRTKEASEMLFQRRLSTLEKLVEECKLLVTESS